MFNKGMEAIDREELRDLQLERLQMTVYQALDNVRFYRKIFRDLGLEPGDINSLDDLSRLPFTTKADLLAHSPYGFLARPLRDIVRFHTTSGLHGRTCIAAYTKGDLKAWRELMARLMIATGVTAQDIVQVAFAYGLHTGGIAFELGAETIDASVVPSGQAPVCVQIDIMHQFRSTVLAATPSFARHLTEVIQEKNLDPKALDLRIGLFGAEPWSEKIRAHLDNFLAIQSYDIYGLAELIGPGVAGECYERNGLHLAEDMFIGEIVDPKTGRLMEPDQTGELVLTTLTREAQPLIRYRTGDLTRMETSKCSCGRTLSRLTRIQQRTDDVIIFQGVSVLPEEVSRVLTSMPGLRPDYEIIVDHQSIPGELHLMVETHSEMTPVVRASQRTIAEQLAAELARTTGVEFRVTLLPPHALAGKVHRRVQIRS